MTRPYLLILGLCIVSSVAVSADKSGSSDAGAKAAPTLEQTRDMMNKWIDMQQLISKERRDWQQGKEMLTGRVELVKKEIDTLNEKMSQTLSTVSQNDKKKAELLADDNDVKATTGQLLQSIANTEVRVRRLFKRIPEPIQQKLDPLFKAIPEDVGATKASAAERFRNVLGILNELNKANNEITLSVEFRDLAGGKTQVDVIYVGLSQAYYISAKGETGVGRPTADGWKWEPAPAISKDVQTALEILQGKHSPAFVPLPAKVQFKP
jgi:hypothetical protein